MDTTEFKGRLNTAFSSMRRQGLIARQNFSCCGSCAGYELATKVTEMPAARRAKVAGCAFYTRQTWGNFEGSRNPQGITINYGQLGTQAHGQVGLPTEAVGQVVAKCLEEAGLTVEWDGDPNRTIYVRFSSERQ